MINYGRQSIDKKDIQSVVKVLKSDYLTQGPVVKKFETELSTYFKSKFALAVSSGTSALNISSKILKWKKNDIVFVSPITFLASSNCIEESGATPYFIDINLEDYSINLLDRLSNEISVSFPKLIGFEKSISKDFTIPAIKSSMKQKLLV